MLSVLFTVSLAQVIFAEFETQTKMDIFYYYFDFIDFSPCALGINIPAMAQQREFIFLPLVLWWPPHLSLSMG